MARIEYMIPVESIGDRIGDSDIVMFKSKFGTFARAFTPPTDPQSADQAAVRAFLAASSKQWSQLTDAQRQDWEDYAAAFFEI